MIRTGLALAVGGAVLLFAGPLGSRLGLWSFIIGFLLLGLSLLMGLVGASLGLVSGFKTGQWGMAALTILAGLAVVGIPSAFVLAARGKPPIHDITTDPDNPPIFVAALPLRATAANPPEYLGGDVTVQQRRAYPDIQPLILRSSTAETFDRARAVVGDLGWELVGEDRSMGRIEAVDTTFWFGFKDDVVIRITPGAGDGSRVDVRSKSRVGLGDLGTNARRVREFLLRLQSRS